MRLEKHRGKRWVILITLLGSVLIETVLIAYSISIFFSFLLLKNSTLGEELLSFPGLAS